MPHIALLESRALMLTYLGYKKVMDAFLSRNKENLIFLLIALSIAFLIANQAVGKFINDEFVIQDDFRQSLFWFWQFWDADILANSYFKEMYLSNSVRTPLFLWIFKMGPNFTSSLVYFSKFIALCIYYVSVVFCFLFFEKLTKNKFLSLAFTIAVSVALWCTDHVSAASPRSFVWAGLFAYMYFKQDGKNIAAAISSTVILLLSPITFLLCLAMEFFHGVLHHGTKFFDIKNKAFLGMAFNTLITGFMYLVLFRNISMQGVGTPFTVDEMKVLPEFNPGGRHPIFGSNLGDGTWWMNEHWGMGIGYLKISSFILVALALIVIYAVLRRKEIINKEFFKSIPMILFYSSVTLHFVAQLIYPTIYLPSRYIAIPFLLLSLVSAFLILNQLGEGIFDFKVELSKKEEREGISAANQSKLKYQGWLRAGFALSLAFGFWFYYKKFYHTRFVKINASVAEALKQSPKDSVVAAHPALPDISSVEILAQRAVFADYERAMAYTRGSLEEIRRRNQVSLQLVYAKTADEFYSLAEANGITHFLAHIYFYSPQYLANPRYLEPYNQLLRGLVQRENGQRFFVEEFLLNAKSQYAVIDIQRMKKEA